MKGKLVSVCGALAFVACGTSAPIPDQSADGGVLPVSFKNAFRGGFPVGSMLPDPRAPPPDLGAPALDLSPISADLSAPADLLPAPLSLAGVPPEGTFAVVRDDTMRVVDLSQNVLLTVPGPPAQVSVVGGETVYYWTPGNWYAPVDLFVWWPGQPAPRIVGPILSGTQLVVASNGLRVAFPDAADGTAWADRDGPLTHISGRQARFFGGDLYFNDAGGIWRLSPSGQRIFVHDGRLGDVSSDGSLMTAMSADGKQVDVVSTVPGSIPVGTFAMSPIDTLHWLNRALFVPGSTRLHLQIMDSNYYNGGQRWDWITGMTTRSCGGDPGGVAAVSHNLSVCVDYFSTGSMVSIDTLAVPLGIPYGKRSYLLELRPDDQFAVLVYTEPMFLNPISLILGDAQGGHALPEGTRPPVTWVDNHSVLYLDGERLERLDTGTWNSQLVLDHVADYRWAAVGRLFYVVSGHGTEDGLYWTSLQ